MAYWLIIGNPPQTDRSKNYLPIFPNLFFNLTTDSYYDKKFFNLNITKDES